MLKRLLSSNKEEAKDTGLAMVLIFLLFTYFTNNYQFLNVSILLLLITMIWPGFFGPLSFIWFGLSRFLGTIVSNIILTFLFFLLVTPIGLIRRISGADSLYLNQWKKNEQSVFKVRNYKNTEKDLEKPF